VSCPDARPRTERVRGRPSATTVATTSRSSTLRGVAIIAVNGLHESASDGGAGVPLPVGARRTCSWIRRAALIGARRV
jgi:hypothetical protein